MIPSKIREILFYSLGAALIGGFVYLYASRFSFIAFRTPALNLFLRLGPNWAIAINAGVFILFLLFLPYRRSIAWRSKGAFAAFILALMAEMFGVPLLLFIFSPLLPAFIPDRTLRLQLYEWASPDSRW